MKQVTLLLVEDEYIIAFTTQKLLEKYNYKVIIAENGEEALKAMKVSNFGIDLILMDIDLGVGLDGTETASIILENYDIPILFHSSHTESHIVDKTEGITSYGYVVKNSGIVVLDASIKMALKLYHANHELLRLKEISEKNERSYIDLMEALDEGLIIADKDGSIQKVNKSVCNMFGFKNEGLIGVHMTDLYANAEDRQLMLDRLQEKQILRNYEVELKKKEGSTFKASCTIRLLVDSKGEVQGTQGIIRNIET